MLKKFLAGLSALVLSVGMIALVAGPASAHTPTISADCTALTVHLTNYQTVQGNSTPNTVTVTIDGTALPTVHFGTSFSQTYNFAQGAAQHSYRVQIVAADDSKYNYDSGVQTVSGCTDDLNKKIPICHATSSDTNPYVSESPDVNSIVNGDGHGHSGVNIGDIIPPFDYTEGGVLKHYAGQNWTTGNQVIYNNGCDLKSVGPTTPTPKDADCTAAGQYGTGSFTIASVPNGVQYRYSTASSSGPWTSVGAGTTPVAAGLTVWIQAIALDGYKLTGTTSWHFTIGHPTATHCVSAPDVVFHNAYCNVDTTGTTGGKYTITAAPHISYTLSLNGGAPQPILPNTYNAQPGDLVVITAVPDASYTLVGTASPWSHTFTDPGDCLDGATAANVVFHDAYCNVETTGTTGGTYTITAAAHISYTLSLNGGAPTSIVPGQYPAQPGDTIVVTAVPDAGYKLVNTASPWSHTFSNPGDCLDNATAPNVVFQDGFCNAATTGTTDGTYTITAASHISYTVSVNAGAPAPILPGQYTAQPGDTIVITAVPDAGYKLVNTASPWSHTFTDPGDCLDKASAGDPAFVDSICEAQTTGSTQGTYEIVAADHITYTVSVNGGSPAAVLPGTYDAQPDDLVVITAIPDAGYKLDGTASPWSHTFADPGACLDTVVPVPPGHTDETCTVDEGLHGHFHPGSIILPATTGVQYAIDGTVPDPADGTPVAGGTAYPATDGAHSVSAVALTGYKLDASYTAPYPVTILAALACGDLIDHPLVEPIVASVQPTCTTGGSFTLSNSLATAGAVIWTVDGSPVSEGTYPVTGTRTVTIHAAANGPDFGFVTLQKQDWTLDFSAPANCDLKTLALTGSSPVGGFVLAYFLLIAGIGIVTVRTVRNRPVRPSQQ